MPSHPWEYISKRTWWLKIKFQDKILRSSLNKYFPTETLPVELDFKIPDVEIITIRSLLLFLRISWSLVLASFIFYLVSSHYILIRSLYYPLLLSWSNMALYIHDLWPTMTCSMKKSTYLNWSSLQVWRHVLNTICIL